ncbi:lon protease homolog 2, peroxisomal-like isoform X2 [Tubulanus polymorphus]|uniref:lon protease homolog 2, peroxisomal-like isoform X2 n=1 Tax=Tubulanus polymorphus TaxID=672921 RepID=UPI003DA2C9F0
MAASITIPRKLPLLIVADNVLLPGSTIRLPIKRLSNLNLVKSRLLGRNTLSSTIIGVIPKEPNKHENGDGNIFHKIGTAAVVVQVTGTNWPTPNYTVLITGICRFKIEEILQEMPYPIAMVTQLEQLAVADEIDEQIKLDPELGVVAENFREQALKLVDMLDVSIPVVAKLKKMLDDIPNHQLPDVCASIVKASVTERIQILDAIDLRERYTKALPLLMRQIEGMKLLRNAKRSSFEIIPRRKENNIRRFLKQRPKMHGYDDDDENDDEIDEIQEIEQKIKSVKMPDNAMKTAMKEFKRLKTMPSQMPEHAMLRNYLELMVDLPWGKSTEDHLDIEQARTDLDDDHFGLEKLKRRVLEFLAVKQLKNSLKGPILCFVGPPGVGKTSVGRSVARTLGRQFHRIALGGVYDQSDIRGHRRTYIGSMPGRVIQGLRTVGVNNPVFLLDEVDKLSRGLHGDPAAALLEVLDPEQNHSFTDHYLNVPFDLSQVLFIATANTTSTIPPALLDRMEVIEIMGYTQEEKVHIASRYLVPKQLEKHGLTSEHLEIPNEMILQIISKHTREAGVRDLERQLAAVCRAVAVRVAKTSSKNPKLSDIDDDASGDDAAAITSDHHHSLPLIIDEPMLDEFLGCRKYEIDTVGRLNQPGVCIGLAWTSFGGEIMYIEASRMDGEGKVKFTGKLGDVMKESASLALSWVRSNARLLYIQDASQLMKTDLHIHFPAGAVPKDGPSAGVAIVTVLVSLFTGQCVRSDTAMTGEITLRGLVLPVGGIKEKVLAAYRTGIHRVILPKKNKKDLWEIPQYVQVNLIK